MAPGAVLVFVLGLQGEVIQAYRQYYRGKDYLIPWAAVFLGMAALMLWPLMVLWVWHQRRLGRGEQG